MAEVDGILRHLPFHPLPDGVVPVPSGLGRCLIVSREPEQGDRVVVPWGVDGLMGVVVKVYGVPGRRRALVTVPIHGASGETLEETTISVSLGALDKARSLATFG